METDEPGGTQSGKLNQISPQLKWTTDQVGPPELTCKKETLQAFGTLDLRKPK